ncbi:3-oxoacyl-ACP reductase [Flavimobilis sp. GY10621]|uniref:3-oxoacyl-ACP reductase n=1 Tax=Flavimobilis rhizosphaerae TaxID=2775421 RepID=A0ABR9DPN1_9MICO|nr:3-oxoacyl-ACP reductase [Flavimobilis rhizosphaerae]MBD9697960.1 3-oxoacyl-ACP reductase [Flavimobilis rhizosphaerae]
MTDRYTHLVNTGFTATLAKRLGLPQPAILRRFSAGDPLVPGPVLVLGPDTHDGSDSDAVAQHLLGLDLDVHRSPSTGTARWGAVVLVLTEIERVEDLSEHVLAAGSVLKQTARGARVVTLVREPQPDDAPALAAARQAVDGFTRSLAKELRGGATANGLVLAGGAAAGGEGVLAPLRWFLSARSAFVDGQLLTVGPADVPAQDDARPLEGRVAVVTGAARGIGAAIARTLARDGAAVVCVDVPAAGEHLAKVANEVRGTALQLDITADDAGERIVAHARARHGRLDVVVHNAGITRDKLLANMDAARWDSVLAVNTAAQLRINDVLLASDLFRDAPRIVSLASTSGIAGNRGQTNYGASKAGVIGMVRATSPLLADVGGTANAVAPGFIETEMTARIPFATREVARRLNSLQQGGQPVDVAEAVAFLGSPGAGAVSGQVLRVCGQNLVGA